MDAKRIWILDQNENRSAGHVVRLSVAAASEQEARALAKNTAGLEGEAAWDRATCLQVGQAWPNCPAILVIDYLYEW